MNDDERFDRIMIAVEKIAVYIESLKAAQNIKSDIGIFDKANRAALDDALTEFKKADEETVVKPEENK